MKVDKSLQEVWNWKEKGYNKRKGFTMEQRIKMIKESAQELCKEYNLTLKTPHSLQK
jgi:hypothetical protein